jgi:hypothetical protein
MSTSDTHLRGDPVWDRYQSYADGNPVGIVFKRYRHHIGKHEYYRYDPATCQLFPVYAKDTQTRLVKRSWWSRRGHAACMDCIRDWSLVPVCPSYLYIDIGL